MIELLLPFSTLQDLTIHFELEQDFHLNALLNAVAFSNSPFTFFLLFLPWLLLLSPYRVLRFIARLLHFLSDQDFSLLIHLATKQINRVWQKCS